MTVTRQDGVYLFTDATRMRISTDLAGEGAFQRPRSAMFDIYIDPNRKTINVDQLQVESPQIRIRKGELRRTSRDDTATIQGTLDAQWDWAAVGRAVSMFVPGTLDMAGQRQVSVNFASTYPVDEPNALLANLDSQASLGFERADYMGLNFGPTEVDIQVQNGLMQIEPFTTTVNQGQFHFAAGANLGRTPALLQIPSPLQMAQNIQITDELTSNFLRYVNPIFADAVGVSGTLSFDCQTLAIPLTGAGRQAAELVGTIAIQDLRLRHP
jgi:hypothetical protein